MNILNKQDRVKMIYTYPTHIDLKNRVGWLDWESNLVVYKEDMIRGEEKRFMMNPRHVSKIHGFRLLQPKYLVLIDVIGRKTLPIDASESGDAKINFKLDELCSATFWKNRAIFRRDNLIIIMAYLGGAFLPFILKWVGQMIGKGVPW